MKLTYQTGIATLIQFILLSFLTLFSQVGSVVSTCRTDSNNCMGNLITSIVFYIVVAVVFGGIWLIGLAAQNLRSKRLALLLIGIEGLTALIALFSVKLSLNSKNIFSITASFVIAVLAVWTISLAFRLMRSEGKRIAHGTRRRHHTIS
jgi:sugar phosphate permease